MEWVGYLGIGVSFSGICAAVVYALCRDPSEQKYCVACNKVTDWHVVNGCQECHWADQQL